MNDYGKHLEGPSGSFPAQSRDGGVPASYSRPPFEQDEFEDDGIDLGWIMQVLLARWYWILAAGALGFALALALSLTATPLYRSTASLELNPPTVPILAGQGMGEQMTVANTDWEFLETQYGLLRSRDLARRVVEDLNLAAEADEGDDGQSPEERIEDRAAGLAGGISVAPIPNSRLVELTYTSASPQEAARVVNGYADAFLRASLDRRFEATSEAREFLADRLATVREQLNQSERALVAYARANGIIMPGGEGEGAASLTATSLASLNAALADAQQRRIAAEQRYRQAGAITNTQSATSGLRAERAALESEYREKSTYLQDDYPDMVRLRARIDAIDEAIRNETSTASNSLQAEYQAALAEENALRARVQQLSGSMLNEQELSVEYSALQREVETSSSLYQALLERYNEIGAIEGVGTPQAAIVDRGRVPGAPFTPNIPRNLVLGLILGLGLGVGLAFVYELLTDTIKTPEDVREKLRQPLLGTIPKKRRNEDLSEQLADPQSAISEAYGSLLTTLQFTTNKGMPSVLTVTSANAAEGKSSTALVLAKRMGGLGKRVLLVDADMRKPSFILEEEADRGLSRLLTGEGSLEDHIVKTGLEGLYLLPSGHVPPNPSLLLSSPSMRELVEQLSTHFDHVILDAPPILGFADAPLLARLSSGVLMIVESGRTRRKAALEAFTQIGAVGARVLGVALTKYAGQLGAYGYGYGSYGSQKAITARSQPHELTPELFSGGNSGEGAPD